MKKWLCGLMAAILSLALTGPALAIVPPPENTFVGDYAQVLSEETEQYILEQNDKLNRATGGAIVVVTVDFMDGMESADYAYECFNTWQIGDKDRNNGLLLVYAVGENKVWTMAGVGIEDALSADVLNEWLEQYFYAPYDAGDYDRATRAYFDVAYGWFDSYYGGIDRALDGDSEGYVEPVPDGGEGYLEEYSTDVVDMIISALKAIGVFVVLIVLVVLFVATGLFRSHGSFRSYGRSSGSRSYRSSSRPRRSSSSHRSSSSRRSSGFGGGRTRGGGAGR